MSHSAHLLPATGEAISRAADLLGAGRLVILATETVYGLGADATNDKAVAEIFRAKGRPQFNPLIVHVADADAARLLVDWNQTAERLAGRFWPGPLTLVLTRRDPCPASLLASAGLDTIAIRVPAHPVASAVLKALGRPIAAPSANRSGEMSPTTAEHAAQSLGDHVSLVLDGGPCAVGIESTIIDLAGPAPRILRPGGITEEEMERVIGTLASGPEPASERPRAPGMLARHYAPNLPLRLNATEVAGDEALLAFGSQAPDGAAATLNLSISGDLTEAAANLFVMLHALDRPGRRGWPGRRRWRAIAVMEIPQRGLGRAINDRLRRAAAPRTHAPDLPPGV